MVGNGDRAAFFKIFDLGPVTGAGLGFGERTLRAVGKAVVSDAAWCYDGNDGNSCFMILYSLQVYSPSAIIWC